MVRYSSRGGKPKPEPQRSQTREPFLNETLLNETPFLKLTLQRSRQRTRHLARRVADLVPLTWRGVFVTLFSLLALWRFGYGSLDLLLFVIGVSGVVLVVASAITVTASTVYLRRRIDPAPLATRRLEAGSPIRTGFRMPALRRVPLVRVAWQWLEPGGVECRQVPKDRWLLEEVVATHRGQAKGIKRRFTVGDAFGLTGIVWQRDDPGSLAILPHVGRLKNMPVLQPMASAEGMPHPMGAPEGDRMEIRRYVPGDSVRNILWKTFARTRELNVRTPEKSIDHARKTVAYLLTGEDDEAASAAARVALQNKSLGNGWLFGADGTTEPAESLDAALEAIARSGSFRRRSNASAVAGNGSAASGNGSLTTGLASFLERQGNQGDMHCIIFAPASAGPWTAEALALTRNFSGAVSFVLGTDGVSQQIASPLWRRVLFVDTKEPGINTDELSEIMRHFASAGCPAQVVDRASGRSFNHHSGRGLGAMG